MNNETKRQLKQPRKDVLRDWLRDAASKIETLQGRLVWWEEHHETELQAAIDALNSDRLPSLFFLVVGFLSGAFVVAIYEALS